MAPGAGGHLCSHNTLVSQIFKRLGTNRWGWVDSKKVKAQAQVLDRLQWNDETIEAVWEGTKTNEQGFVHIKLFDEWFVSEDIKKRSFVKTFIERELSGEDKGACVDLLMEFPTAPNVRKTITFHPGRDVGLTCSKTHAEKYNGFSWDVVAMGYVDWVVRNSQAGRAGVKQHWIIVSIAGEESSYCPDKIQRLAEGDHDFDITFDAQEQAMAAWSPLRKTSAHFARIIGYGENGGIRIRMDTTGHELTVRKGQIALKHTQKGREDHRFARHHDDDH